MGYILHTTRYMEPDEYHFDDDDSLDSVVVMALEGMYECRFSINKITDENGVDVLGSEDAIIDYAYEYDL